MSALLRRDKATDPVTESDIAATYKDGLLEIRIPVPEQPLESEPKKIAITKG